MISGNLQPTLYCTVPCVRRFGVKNISVSEQRKDVSSQNFKNTTFHVDHVQRFTYWLRVGVSLFTCGRELTQSPKHGVLNFILTRTTEKSKQQMIPDGIPLSEYCRNALQFEKLLIKKFTPSSHHLISLRSKFSLRRYLKHLIHVLHFM